MTGVVGVVIVVLVFEAVVVERARVAVPAH
jgi:hypothetical protein